MYKLPIVMSSTYKVILKTEVLEASTSSGARLNGLCIRCDKLPGECTTLGGLRPAALIVMVG